MLFRSKVWLTTLLDEATVIVAHNAQFDWGMLVDEGVEMPQEKWLDTMLMHQLVNPWRMKGLGKCAPLYVPGLTPWKHKSGDDMEGYSLWDAAVLIPMFYNLQSTLVSRHQWRVCDTEHRWMWSQYNCGCHMENYRVDDVESEVTKAALIPESCRVDLGSVRDAVGVLCGARPTGSLPPEVERRHLLGYSPRQIRRGCREVGPLPQLQLDEKEGDTKRALVAYDEENPAFKKFREHTRHMAKKDGYIVAPSGHRAYGFREGEAQRFVIFNCIATQYKEEAP